MKNSVKGIIALSVALVALGGGATALLLTDPDKGGESGSVEATQPATEQQAKILIYDNTVSGTDPETGESLEGIIKTVKVKNKTDEYSVVQKSAQTADSDVTYTLEGYEDIAMEEMLIGTLANNANGLTSEAIIEENCTDLAKFGLDKPEVTVDVEYESGTKCRMLIGNPVPVGTSTYVMIDGINTVFSVRNSAITNYSKTAIELVETTILENPEVAPIVEKLTIDRENLNYDLVMEYDYAGQDENNKGGTSATHIMIEPTWCYLAVERSTDVVQGMFGLSADSVYAVHCTESDIAESGLKEPFCTVTMECDDGNDYELLLSEPFEDGDGKSCYGMLRDSNVIYIIDSDDAKWLTVEPVDIASRVFIASYVWNIPELSVTCGNDKYDFEITKVEGNEDDGKLTSADFTTTLNGESFDTERYRLFYSFLVKANAEDFAIDEKIPAGKPMAVLEFKDDLLDKTLKYEFYEKNSMQALVVADGKSKFNISKSYVETLIENAKNLKSDEEFKMTWK